MKNRKAFANTLASLTLTALTIAFAMPFSPVLAGENTAADYSLWSEAKVDGWELEWTAGECFDTLIKASNDMYSITYDYDCDGNRTAKTVNGVTTYFTYDEYGFLIKEVAESSVIEYRYGYNEEFDYVLTGFAYNNTEYEYGYSDGKITEIIRDGETEAKYEYFYDICETVLGKADDGSWTDKSSDADFIGNINRIRMKQSYCDAETGWYYCGRYYSPELIRFIDGISEEKAAEIKAEHPEYPEYEVDSKIYTNGVNLRPVNGRAAQLSQEETVRRVIMLESPENELDQDCVGWVIRNRQHSTLPEFANVNTVYGIVTQQVGGEYMFSTYKSKEFNNFSEFASKPLWEHTYKIYVFLMAGAPYITKPTGYTDQLYFSSIKTFMAYSRVEGGTFYYNDKGQTNTYTNCWCIPTGTLTSANVSRLTASMKYWGVYNVFCEKHFGV